MILRISVIYNFTLPLFNSIKIRDKISMSLFAYNLWHISNMYFSGIMFMSILMLHNANVCRIMSMYATVCYCIYLYGNMCLCMWGNVYHSLKFIEVGDGKLGSSTPHQLSGF